MTYHVSPETGPHAGLVQLIMYGWLLGGAR
jgi:hypothetical protein